MNITFDRNARIAGIGLVPWTRLGPERWLPNYKIASLYGWDLGHLPGAPEVFALSGSDYGMPELAKHRSQDLLESKEFQQLIIDMLPGYDFITYKPVAPPQALLDAGCRFLSMNQALTQTLENKAAFREQFAGLGLPFPPYKIVRRKDVAGGKVRLPELLGGRGEIILQDEKLGGGRGTFVISNQKGLEYALASIEKLGGGERLVVSERIAEAFERSVQACVTREHGTFVGPLQKQIIGHPLLANLEVPDGDRFCGAEISASDPLQAQYAAIKTYACKIGGRLRQLGYHGIFSVDCLIDRAGNLYVIEINPRLTGITPLVTMLYREGRDIPFYLLHLLEAANMRYEITDDYVDPLPSEGSLLVLHSQAPHKAHIAAAPASGRYGLPDLRFQAPAYRLSAGRELLLQRYTPPGFTLKPGGRLMTAFLAGRVLDDDDRLRPGIADAVEELLNQVTLKEVVI